MGAAGPGQVKMCRASRAQMQPMQDSCGKPQMILNQKTVYRAGTAGAKRGRSSSPAVTDTQQSKKRSSAEGVTRWRRQSCATPQERDHDGSPRSAQSAASPAPEELLCGDRGPRAPHSVDWYLVRSPLSRRLSLSNPTSSSSVMARPLNKSLAFRISQELLRRVSKLSFLALCRSKFCRLSEYLSLEHSSTLSPFSFEAPTLNILSPTCGPFCTLHKLTSPDNTMGT